jgi:hypothetical protein
MIEPLESRIAPAAITLVAYNYNDKYVNSQGQTLMQFYNAADPTLTGSNLAIAKTVGLNSNVYFMKISSGEDLQIYNTSIGAENEVDVVSGTVVAFFTNADPSITAPDHATPPVTGPQVLGTDLTGLALGNKVSVSVGGGVYGDIVTNYNDTTGTLGGIAEQAGHATQLLNNTVTSLSVAGPVNSFVTGGNVSFFEAGSIQNIFTGTAANNYTFQFVNPANNPIPGNPPGDITLSVPTPGNGIAAPSLNNVVLGSLGAVGLPGQIFLGAGGPGGAGGSLHGFTLLSDSPLPAQIYAGMGGNGVAARPTGGAGGAISNVLIHGPQSPTGYSQSNALLDIEGGKGGSGFGTAGRGGAGGAVSTVYFGYAASGPNAGSNYFLPDDVLIKGGDGGSGGYAGAGGSLNNINVLTTTPHVSGGMTAEIRLLGGQGGTATLAGGGTGGSVSNVYVNDAEFLAGTSIQNVVYQSSLRHRPIRAWRVDLPDPDRNSYSGRQRRRRRDYRRRGRFAQ